MVKVGIAVYCLTCGHRKKPTGRSAPIGVYMCDDSCPGYRNEPQPGDLWPRESEKDFGYPVSSHATREVPER
jgi:hypothetical protein